MKYAKWIRSPRDTDSATVSFSKEINFEKDVTSALIKASSVGIYILTIDGKKVGDRVFTPGFTSYENRVMYQDYDVTDKIRNGSTLAISVGPGWAVGHLGYSGGRCIYSDHVSAICELELTYDDGRKEIIGSDCTWDTYTHPVTFSDIYNGETVDMTVTPENMGKAVEDHVCFPLVPDNGLPIKEHEKFTPKLIVTPKGERVLDFGQNMTGYVTLNIKGKRGGRIVLSHGEVLDGSGNFYNENYRAAQNKITYILSGENDFFKPQFSFQGFRYVRIDEYPDTKLDINGFAAVAVHSDMERTGFFECGNTKINQLYHNIIWGQKSNYLDIPTDCPQRDERLGWTGDAQVFCRTAAINYDVKKFFEKWLTDIRAEQKADGAVMGTCPEKYGTCSPTSNISTGWGDVATIAPWTLYELYGDKKILEDNFELMRGWVEYMHSAGPEEFLWLGGCHYGDWLAMDYGEDSYVGATSNDLIASAFYAHSTELLVKAGEVLDKNMDEYKTLHKNVISAFRQYFMENGMPKEEIPYNEEILGNRTEEVNTATKGMTQTALTLILHFGLCTEEEKKPLIDKLCELIHKFGGKMSTGFIGTPYILHVLSDNGRSDIAYKLLFNEGNPSWLYSVNHGATTIWEHCNGVKEDGSFWSPDMNSFNHYAYGAVGDWLYGAVSGIKVNGNGAGYKDITIEPIPNKRLGYAKTTIKTPQGLLVSGWKYEGDTVKYEFTVPKGTKAKIVLPNGLTKTISDGTTTF